MGTRLGDEIAETERAIESVNAGAERFIIANTRRAIRALGLTASRRDGELRINLRGGTELTAYGQR